MLYTLYTTTQSPLGELLLAGAADSDGPAVLTSVSFTSSVSFAGAGAVTGGRQAPGAFESAIQQLAAYFAGDLRDFDLARADGGSPFQRRVWNAVDAIAYGSTVTYGEIAARIGAPRDRIRAVAAAIGANPLLIVRPCHRVIGASGSLTGYAGGVERKLGLLTLEGALQPVLP